MMNYSAEIGNVMKQAHSLWYEIEARGKANGRDGEYRRLYANHSVLEHRQCDLRRQAAEEFAALNGWRWITRSFLARTLARGGTHEGKHDGGGSWGPFGARDETMDAWTSHVLFDHPLFFREPARPYRTAAIVGQPYDTSADTARAAAIAIGLELHVPTNINASWHYPGWTRFFCFTQPKIGRVHFLPEQMQVTHEKEDA